MLHSCIIDMNWKHIRNWFGINVMWREVRSVVPNWAVAIFLLWVPECCNTRREGMWNGHKLWSNVFVNMAYYGVKDSWRFLIITYKGNESPFDERRVILRPQTLIIALTRLRRLTSVLLLKEIFQWQTMLRLLRKGKYFLYC